MTLAQEVDTLGEETEAQKVDTLGEESVLRNPDSKNMDWINRLVAKMWPRIDIYLRQNLFKQIEKSVQESVPGFKFPESSTFGNIFPTVTVIRVFDSDNEKLVIDLQILFQPDIGLEIELPGRNAILQDLYFSGMLRIVLLPLIPQPPFLGGVQIFFLNKPNVDYQFKGVAKVLNILKSKIDEEIRKAVVLPNKIIVPFGDKISMRQLASPKVQGVIRVTVHGAEGLRSTDTFTRSDPYFIINVGARQKRSKTISNTLNPKWKETFDFPVEIVIGQKVILEIFDDDVMGDDFLGRLDIECSMVAGVSKILEKSFELEDKEYSSGNRNSRDSTLGKTKLSLQWYQITKNDLSVPDEIAKDEEYLGIVELFIEGCHGLPKSITDAPDTSFILEIESDNDKEVQMTKTKEGSGDILFEEGFVILSSNPDKDEIRLNLKKSGEDDIIGTTIIKVKSLMETPTPKSIIQTKKFEEKKSELKMLKLVGKSSEATLHLYASYKGLREMVTPASVPDMKA